MGWLRRVVNGARLSRPYHVNINAQTAVHRVGVALLHVANYDDIGTASGSRRYMTAGERRRTGVLAYAVARRVGVRMKYTNQHMSRYGTRALCRGGGARHTKRAVGCRVVGGVKQTTPQSYSSQFAKVYNGVPA